jgi:DNA-binding transcriptional ArsR family regulator
MDAKRARAVRAPVLADMERHAGEAARLLRALSSPHRLQVLCALVGGELSVGALNRRVPLSQSALSQHLAVLRTEGLVATRREGQTIYYALPEGAALHVIRALHEVYCGVPARPPARKRRTTT